MRVYLIIFDILTNFSAKAPVLPSQNHWPLSSVTENFSSCISTLVVYFHQKQVIFCNNNNINTTNNNNIIELSGRGVDRVKRGALVSSPRGAKHRWASDSLAPSSGMLTNRVPFDHFWSQRIFFFILEEVKILIFLVIWCLVWSSKFSKLFRLNFEIWTFL